MKGVLARINFILDGDTINCTDSQGNTFNSRARWIDTPEFKKRHQLSSDEQILNHWQWGQKTKTFISELLQPIINERSTIILFNYQADLYGRTLSDWYLANTRLKNNLQYQLIAQGLAQPFLPFNKYDFNSRELALYKGIIDGVAKSYKQSLGFWADYKSGKFILPSDFKQLLKVNLK
jgi:endonuclease YncB( thermonuclease family)